MSSSSDNKDRPHPDDQAARQPEPAPASPEATAKKPPAAAPEVPAILPPEPPAPVPAPAAQARPTDSAIDFDLPAAPGQPVDLSGVSVIEWAALVEGPPSQTSASRP